MRSQGMLHQTITPAQERARHAWVTRKLCQAKFRSRRDGIPMTLTRADIYLPDLCPVFGFPLQYGVVKPGGNPHGASLDRFDNAKGYVPGNAYVISYLANRLKSSATVEQLQRLADYATNGPPASW